MASAQAKKEGFKILSMQMKDCQDGKVLWKEATWKPEDMWNKEMVAHIPKEILKCKAVSRDIAFSSVEQMKEFRVVQNVKLNGSQLEEWRFKFGFVMPGSSNTWSSIIEAASPDKMLSPEVLSGNVVIETQFFDGDVMIANSAVRIFYD